MFDSVYQGRRAFLFLINVHSNNLHRDAPFKKDIWKVYYFFKCLFLKYTLGSCTIISRYNMDKPS